MLCVNTRGLTTTRGLATKGLLVYVFTPAQHTQTQM